MLELNGYIKLYRKLIKWRWYQDSVVKSLFLHCLLMASFRDFDWMGQNLQAGQFVTSYKRLSEDLGFSVQQIRTALKKLESTGELTSKSTNKYTIVTVMNWESHQIEEESDNKQSNTPITNEQQTDNKQATNEQQHRKNNKELIRTNKNVKKSSSAARPQLSEILSYVAEHDLNVDGKIFFEHYENNGWKTECGNPVTDWQKLLRVWSRKELNERRAPVNGYANVKALEDD